MQQYEKILERNHKRFFLYSSSTERPGLKLSLETDLLFINDFFTNNLNPDESYINSQCITDETHKEILGNNKVSEKP